MYISSIIQPDNSKETLQPTDAHLSPYRITPCAKAIGALLLVLGSTTAWADSYDESDIYGPDPFTAANRTDYGDFISRINAHVLHEQQNATNWAKAQETWRKQDLERMRAKAKASAAVKQQEFAQGLLKFLTDTPSIEATSDTTHEKVIDDTLVTEVNDIVTEIGHVSQTILSHPKSNLLLHAKPEVSATIAETQTAKKSPPPAPKPKTQPAPKPILKSPPLISHNTQAGSYLANQMAAQQMFITDDLQHRQGETPYTDPMTGEQKVTGMWLNTNGAITRFSSGQDQLHTKGTRYSTQLGGKISQWSSGEHDLGILGITAGIGKASSRSNSTASQHQANGSVVGYNLGLYSVWNADNISQLGPYIGLLAQYGMFNNQVKAPEVVTGANYKSYIFTTALETGYKIQLIEKEKAKLFVQPQAKVLWQRSSGLQHKELTAPQIKIEEHNTVTTKLGLLTALELGTDTLSTTNTLKINPFIEANWINSNGNKGLLLDDIHITPQGINNIAELKLGVESKFNNNLKLWSHLGQQLGKHNYSDTQATLGINYQF